MVCTRPIAALLAVVITCGFSPARARGAEPAFAPDLLFHHWRQQEGLPDDSVTALLQSHDGYLWVGTIKGLARFDGVEFENFPLPVTSGHRVVAITSLGEDSFRRIWIGTPDDGLYYWDATGTHAFRPRTGSLPLTITSLADDHRGSLWIGTPAGVRQWRLDRWEVDKPAEPLAEGYVTSLHAARSGKLWITTRSGMLQYQDGKLTPVEFSTEELGRSPEYIGLYEDRVGNLWAFGDSYLVNLNEGKRFNYFRGGDAGSLRIWTLFEGRDGELWIATSGQGLFSFYGGQFRPLALRENRLSSDVRAMCDDDEGNLWLGTSGGGLVRLQRPRSTLLDTSCGLPNETPAAIAAESGGRLWVGYCKNGLYSQAGQVFVPQTTQSLISSLAVDGEGGVWFGNLGNGLVRLKNSQRIVFDTSSGLGSDTIPALAAGPGGEVWVGTSAGTIHSVSAKGWVSYGRQNGLSGYPVSALLTTTNGGLWAGTTHGEVFQKLGEQWYPLNPPELLRGATVHALDVDAQGNVWVGTLGSGLACLRSEGHEIWNTKNGFPTDTVLGVLADSSGQVWASAEDKIFVFKPAETNAPVFRVVWRGDAATDKSADFGFPSVLRTADGRMWFAMPGKLVAVDPREAGDRLPPLPLYIKRVIANGEPVMLSSNAAPARLPAFLNSLEIAFAAINLTEPEKVRCYYKLEGFDADWIDCGAERKARYGRLPYGTYTFRLRARNVDGTWCENTAELALLHPPPWWASWWAITGYSLLAVVGVVVAVREVSHRRLRLNLARLAQQQAMEKERMRIAQDMHDEIGSKLTKISYLTELPAGESTQSEEHIRSIAVTSRELLQSLDEIVWAVNPHNDSLEHLASYFSHHATEYLHHTSVELDLKIPENLPAIPLSAETRHNLFLAFEEALGNALKHSKATKIQVDMAVQRDEFRVTIRDNGIGFDPARANVERVKKGGNGVGNMRRRLAEINGECRIESQPSRGTAIILQIRLSQEQAVNS